MLTAKITSFPSLQLDQKFYDTRTCGSIFRSQERHQSSSKLRFDKEGWGVAGASCCLLWETEGRQVAVWVGLLASPNCQSLACCLDLKVRYL